MNINVFDENGVAVIAPDGRLDHLTTDEFEAKICELGKENDTLILEMKNVEYVSSAALRVILKAYDMLESKGGLKLRNVNSNVMEILKITGFADSLDII